MKILMIAAIVIISVMVFCMLHLSQWAEEAALGCEHPFATLEKEDGTTMVYCDAQACWDDPECAEAYEDLHAGEQEYWEGINRD